MSKCTIDLELTVGGGLKGVSVEEELWKEESPFEELGEEYKSSRFWIEIEWQGENLVSEKRLWDQHFVITEEKGDVEFGIKERRELDPSIALRDQLRRSLWVDLYEERPVIVTEKDESEGAEEGATIDRLEMEEDKPKFEKKYLGGMKIQTTDWLLKS